MMNLYKLRRALRFRRGDNNGHTVAHRARFTPEEEDLILRAADKLDPDGRAPPQDVIACFAIGAAKAILAGESAATVAA